MTMRWLSLFIVSAAVTIAGSATGVRAQAPDAQLDPSRFLRSGVDTIAVVVEMPGRSIPFATAIYSLRMTTRGGRAAWERSYRWLGNDGSRTADTLWFDAHSLAPIENHRHNSVQDAVTRFQASSAQTHYSSQGNAEQLADTTVAGPLYASGEFEELIGSSPLAIGYGAAYTLYYGPPRQLARLATFKVVRSDTTSGKDGKKVECWVVDASLSEGKSTFFVGKADRRVVRLVNHEDPSAAFIFLK